MSAIRWMFFGFLLGLLGCTTEFEGVGEKEELFMKFFGGSGEDIGNALLSVDDGYVVIGSTTSFGTGDSDLYLVLTDKSGNTRVEKSIGGGGNQSGNSIMETGNGFLSVGYTEDSTGNTDIWLLEMNFLGDSLRSWTFGSPDIDESGIDLKATSDGNLVITATRYVSNENPDTYLIKLDSDMNMIWENKNALSDLPDLFGKNVIESQHSELIYCSTSKRSRTGDSDMRLTAVNSIGDLSWSTYFGETGIEEKAHAVIEHLGAIYVAGSSNSAGRNDTDIIIVRTDKQGNKKELFSLGSVGISEVGKQLVSLRDGHLLVIGERKTPGSNLTDIYIEKVDMSGNAVWEQPYVLSGSLNDFAADALETPEGDLVICGTVSFSGNPMVLLMKMNKEGKLIR